MSEHLTEKFGGGFSETNLEYARKLYVTYVGRISQTLFEEFVIEKTKAVFRQLGIIVGKA